MELVHISEKLAHHKLVFQVILQKLSDYKLDKSINYYKCDKMIIKCIIASTGTEFKSTSLINLLKKYNIGNDIIIKFKNKWLNFIKSLIGKSFNKYEVCEECSKYKSESNIAMVDVSSITQMFIMTNCCKSFQIMNIISHKIEIII